MGGRSPWGLSPISVAQLTSQRTISLRRQVMVLRVIRITCRGETGQKEVTQNFRLAEGERLGSLGAQEEVRGRLSEPYSLGKWLHLSGSQFTHL